MGRDTAQGNDGNLLQHTCELAAMRALVKRCGASRFHVYCTHAMAPRQPCEQSVNPAGRSQLRKALNLAVAKGKPLPAGVVLGTTPLIDAYASLGASESSYPNTALILKRAAESLGVSVSGVLVDGDSKVEGELHAAFPLPDFRVFGGDWRVMPRYRACDAPWLLAMAPETFSNKRHAAHVDAADLKAVGEHIDRVLARTGQNGVATVLCLSMQPSVCAEFWNAAVDAFGNHPLEFVAVAGKTGSMRHVSAIMSIDSQVLHDIVVEVKGSLETVEPI